MRPVRRDELLDWQTYKEGREASRPKVMALKEPRRIHVGKHLTFLFENAETARYQVQEMMLTERIVKEADIAHELATYNELLGGPGELGASLLIEIEDPADRDVKLRAWTTLPAALYVELEDGSRVRPTIDPRQISDEGRLSSVHYLKFDTQGRVPVAIGCDHPEQIARTELSQVQREALKADLAG
jgi:Protein of unknown function (DUF3501)